MGNVNEPLHGGSENHCSLHKNLLANGSLTHFHGQELPPPPSILKKIYLYFNFCSHDPCSLAFQILCSLLHSLFTPLSPWARAS